MISGHSRKFLELSIKDYPGWEHLIRPLMDEADAKGLVVQQIKEKFGSLRFYFSPHDDELSNKVFEAEKASARICPRCGKPDQMVRNIRGWLTNMCDDCIRERG